jgi:hypothetical protein
VTARTTIAFLGQCHTSGYPGVPRELTFPQVCRRAVQVQRPATLVDVVLEPYEHPFELPRAVANALRARAQVVVIEAVGWLTVKGSGAIDLSRLPKRVRTAYQRVRYLRNASLLMVNKLPRASELIHRVETNALDFAGGVMRTLIPRYPRPTPAQYGEYLRDAVRAIARVPGTTAVIQGPGAPNVELNDRHLPADMIERYRTLSHIARGVAAEEGALFVERWDSVTHEFYLPGSVRPQVQGHSIWGNLLAEQLLAAGLV